MAPRTIEQGKGWADVSKMSLPLFLVWTSRVILVAYGILTLAGYWSQLSDFRTTIRIVGSDVGCALSVADCSWLGWIAEKVVGLGVIGVSIGAQSATTWRYRDYAQVAAAAVAILHLIGLRMLLNPS